MKVHFIPKTHLGKWSTWLIVAFIVLFISFQLLVASGQRGGEAFFSNLALSVPIMLAGISGISAFVTGIIGIIMSRERSLLVYLAVFVGLLVIIFLLGELLFAH